MNKKILLTSAGSYLPSKRVSNFEIANLVKSSDEWITKRTGIKYRHFASKGELTSDMGTHAARYALKRANLKPEDIDLIVVATTTPDNTFPSTASKIQKNLNSRAISFDVQAVCAGFVYAISVASSMMKDNFGNKCLVIGADCMSKILDWKDRSTSVLFGDGAGAVVLEKIDLKNEVKYKNWGILSSELYTDGLHYDLLYTDGGVSLSGDAGFVRMLGRDVFKHAVEKLSNSLLAALNNTKYSINDIDWLIPHQANQRIINSVVEKLNFEPNKVISTVSNHGNTSAASIPLALDFALTSNKIKEGDLLAFQAIGGGLSWGSIIVKFGKPKK